MHPLLLELGSLRFHSYPAMLALAFLIPTLLCAREGRLLKNPVYVPVQGAVWLLVFGLFGSKVYFIIQYWGVKHLYRAFFLWEPGLVFYGGIIGGFVGALAYMRFAKYYEWRIFDVGIPYLALGQATGRVGCFLNGCCWGEVCEAPWGVTFPKYSHAFKDQVAEGIIARTADAPFAVHPTQLYSVLGLVTICITLSFCLKRSPFIFSNVLLYLVLYGTLRFIVEFFRGDSARSVAGFTVSQIVALIFVAVGATTYAVVLFMLKNKDSSPPPRPAPQNV